MKGLFYIGVGIMIKSYQGVSQKAFSSNVNALNLRIFPTMVEYLLEDKSLTIL